MVGGLFWLVYRTLKFNFLLNEKIQFTLYSYISSNLIERMIHNMILYFIFDFFAINEDTDDCES